MAEFLYRLGRWSARRAKTVIAAWALVLAAAAAAFILFGGTLTSAVTIPGTETERVTEQLQQALPEAAGGSGRIVLSTTDGEPFTDDQKAAISALVADAAEADGVERVIDPFATEAQRADQQTQIDDGRAQIEAGLAQTNEGRAQIEAGRQELADSQAQLDAAREQAGDSPNSTSSRPRSTPASTISTPRSPNSNRARPSSKRSRWPSNRARPCSNWPRASPPSPTTAAPRSSTSRSPTRKWRSRPRPRRP